MQGVLAEKLGVFVDVQFEVESDPDVVFAWSLASSEGAAGVHNPVESGSLGVSEAGADVAAADLGMPAGTGEEHQVEGAYIHVGRPAGPGEKGGGQELPLVQAGTPEALVAQWPEGAAVVGVQEFGHEWAFLVGA